MKSKRIHIKWAGTLLLFLLVFFPIFLSKNKFFSPPSQNRLIILTSYNKSIRNAFETEFLKYWKEKTGEEINIDWRIPGGTVEVRMVLNSLLHNSSPKQYPNLDIVWGGGSYLFEELEKNNHLMTLNLFSNKKEWFEGDHKIPSEHTGERYYSNNKKWIGTCLREFGICYNSDIIKKLKISSPKNWEDLADPRFFGRIAVADPTKSIEAARSFEMLMQQKIHLSLQKVERKPGESPEECRLRAIRNGWTEGLNIIQRIMANARYFNDSDTKIPRDVAQGDAAAGMCLKSYGQSYHDKFKKIYGSSRLQWSTPDEGSSLSVEPVGILNYSKNASAAQLFAEFLISKRGQSIWMNDDANQLIKLNQLPIRPDFYSNTPLRTSPYSSKRKSLQYDQSITRPAFNALRVIIRSVCIDAFPEMQSAWKHLIKHDLPPRALEKFHDVSYVSYGRSLYEIQEQLESSKSLDLVVSTKRMTSIFRRNYKETIQAAKNTK